MGPDFKAAMVGGGVAELDQLVSAGAVAREGEARGIDSEGDFWRKMISKAYLRVLRASNRESIC